MSDIQPRAAAGLEDDDLEDARPSEVEIPTSSPDEPSSGFSSQKSSHVVVPKATDTTRIGIGLRPDMPDRAVVHTIAPGTPADGIIQPYDHLLVIAGEQVSSAVHAVQLIREAPAGSLHIELVREADLSRATVAIQNGMRNAMASREGLVRRTLVKPTPDAVLGLSFSPEYQIHSVIKMVREGGLAETALAAGDLVKRLNGVECVAPADTARLLREASGRIELMVLPADQVDQPELDAIEQEEEQRRAEQEEEYRAREQARKLQTGGGGCGSHDEDMGGRYGSDAEYEDDEYQGEEDFSEDDDDYDESERARMNDPMPPRPANVGVAGAARRMPPSLSGGMSPATGLDPFPSPYPDSSITSGTRMGGPPLAKGAKPEGWREWLKQRQTKNVAATVPARNSPRSAHPGYAEQRI